MRLSPLSSIDAASSFFRPMSSWIVPWNWFWQRKVPGKRGSALSETMPCGDLEENNWGACIQRFLSSGWTAAINSHLKIRSPSRAPLTRLSHAFRLARQSQRETSDHHQLTSHWNHRKRKGNE